MTGAAAQGGAKKYRYRSEGEEHGPVSADELMELFATHMITAFDQVQVEGSTAWVAAQTVVGGLLESKAGAATAKSTAGGATTSATTSARASTSTPTGQQAAQPLIIPQRGAPAPKPEGSISDEELAASIAYAREQVKRATRIRLSLLVVLFAVVSGLGFRYSTNLRAAAPAADAVFRTDTRITLDAADATLVGAGKTADGTGTYTLVRLRDVTYASDGTVTVAVRDEPSRWRADFDNAPDYSEVRKSVLRDRVITFAGSVPTLSGSAPPSLSPLKLVSVGFDNTALYPDERMWPWPWQSWVIGAPQACSVLALELEDCKGEVSVKFNGFASCAGDRCARIGFGGDWEGVSDGDKIKLTLSGEILRSLDQGVDLSVQATGSMTVRRVVTGGASPNDASMSGAVTYAQTTALAP